MKPYTIIISEEATADIDALVDYIYYEIKEPITALRYHDGLINAIMELSCSADIYAESQYDFIQRNYGPNARHITYKKMTVIYLIDGDYVYVQHIIAGALIR
jgi:plasmid stabilization system protein ParE